MTIQGLTPNQEVSSLLNEQVSSSTNSQDLGRDEFLTLLLAQLEHQNPLSPMDSTEFTAQLSQFSSLEQLFGINDNLAGIQEMLYNQDKENLLELIGNTVKADDNTILIKDGSVVSGSYMLEDEAGVTVSIFDSNGFEIRTLNPGTKDAGEYDVAWDGRDESAEMVEDGIYTFEVTAIGEAGNYVAVNTYISGEVTGVTYQYGVPYLMIGEMLISSDNTIIEVTMTGSGETNTAEQDAEAGPTP